MIIMASSCATTCRSSDAQITPGRCHVQGAAVWNWAVGWGWLVLAWRERVQVPSF